jgi:hypothetical protein
MKSVTALLAIGLVSLGVAGNANATTYIFSPKATHFTGKGNTSATADGVTLACTGKFKGATSATGAIAHITAGSFTGELGCNTVKFSGLPWEVKPLTATTGEILAVTFSDATFGFTCGPFTLPITVGSSGVISFNFAGNSASAPCTNITGTITTTPAVTIVPK